MDSMIQLSLAGKVADTPFTFSSPSLRQIRYLESILEFLSDNLLWHGVALSSREWGELLVAAWRKEFPLPGLTGGVAFIGGNYRSLTHGQCSEVITIAEEMLSRLGVSTESPPQRPLRLRQAGDCLDDLAVVDDPNVQNRPRPTANRSRSSPAWGTVARRVRLPRVFEPDDISNVAPCDTEGEGYEW